MFYSIYYNHLENDFMSDAILIIMEEHKYLLDSHSRIYENTRNRITFI